MQLTILGCYSAVPRRNTSPTSQVLEIKNHVFLIDCGEGTQVKLRKHRIKFNRIKHIFISHLHGDHYFGLIGLISTFRLLTRETELHLYGPKGLKEVITLQLKLSDSWTNFPLIFHELTAKESEVIFEDDQVKVSTVPLDHRIYCNGFLFEEKPGERQLDMNAVLNAKIHKTYYRKLKQGADVVNEDGEIFKNETLTKPPKAVKKYAFCSDTAYNESVVPIIKAVDALYHESTFLKKNEALCAPTKHSTAQQAGRIARLAGVKTLILGHYSTRYDDLELFRDEAQEEFSAVELAEDGKVFSL
jgi:ribonuclease Z